MEEFKRITATPSLSLVLLAATTTSYFYYQTLTLLSDMIFFCVLLIFYGYSLACVILRYLGPGVTTAYPQKYRFLKYKHLLFYFLISACIIVLISNKIPQYTSLSEHPVTAQIQTKVKTIIRKRYHIELLLEEVNSSKSPKLINARYTGENPPTEGSDLAIKTRLYPLSPEHGYGFVITQLRKGVTYSCSLNDKQIDIIQKSPPTLKKMIRQKIMFQLDRIYTQRTAVLLKAIYFGNKNFIDKITINAYKKAGVLHLLAASGLHVGIIISIPMILLPLLRINKTVTYIIALIILYLYVYISDMPVSLLRAAIMFTAYIIQCIFNCQKNIINTLFLSGLIIIILHPYEIFSAGFQLSFMATLGILLFYKKFQVTFALLPTFLRNSLSLTFSAQITTLPLIMTHMGEINLSGILTNIITVPLLGIQVILSLLTNISHHISAKLLWILSQVTELLFTISHIVIDSIAYFNGHFYLYGSMYYRLLVLPLILVPIFIMKRIISLVCIVTAIGFTWTILNTGSAALSDRTILYDRQNDITILKSGGQVYLIGSMKKKNMGNRIVEKLKQYQVDSITLLITGGDYWSIKNYTQVAKAYIIQHCFISNCFIFNNTTRGLFAVLDTDSVPLTLIKGKKIVYSKENNSKEIKIITRLLTEIYSLRNNPGLFSQKHIDYTIRKIAL